MSRQKVALFCTSALVLLLSYQVISDVVEGADMKLLTLLGLGLALALLALLVVEIRSAEKN